MPASAPLYSLHRNTPALAEFQEAARLDPGNPSTQQSLGRLYPVYGYAKARQSWTSRRKIVRAQLVDLVGIELEPSCGRPSPQAKS
jgi:Flp pilus assembly protein TadD